MILFQKALTRIAAPLRRLGPDRLWLWHGAGLAVIFAGLIALQAASTVIFAVVLIAQIVIVFLPTQIALRSHLQALHGQTARLAASKARLRRSNQQLLRLTTHDGLTGLPNRGRMIALIDRKIAQGDSAGHSFLFIGLDGFKSINDTAGPDVGDLVLIAVAQALQSCVDNHHTVARIGGDEFAILTDEPPDQMQQRVMTALADGFDVQGRRLKITASIGCLVMDGSQQDARIVLANAGMALQVAKIAGGHRAQRFTPELREQARLMQHLQMDLPEAIRNGEFEPWFQPQVRLTDGALHGVEVLARWRHPTRGLLTPDRFLAIAERAGMMIEMDHAIWQSAMGHAMRWQEKRIWHPVISLNAAPDTIADPHLIERFLLGLRNSGLAVDQVIVEVLETTLIDGSGDMAAINIDSLAECGIGLELDDFGTGYASLSRLTQLPLKGIKLDRSLVAPLPDQGADTVIRAILALAAELGLHVVAEGVEDKDQAQHLSDRGCKIAQGFGFARPMPAREFETWLRLHASQPVTMTEPPPALAKQA